MPILQALHVTFRDLLRYPEIRIMENQVTFITGASGSGKSTLLRLFNATLSPDGCGILYEGRNIDTLDTISLRRQIILAGQTVFLFDGTIADNFNAFYGFRDAKPLPEAEMRTFLSLCQLNFPLDTDCGILSGGERQRVFLAIHLSFMPRVLMLDEPTSALDTASSDQLLRQLKQFCKTHSITLLVVSHDPQLAEKYADARIFIERGV